ncbi:hypothetical protein C0995_015046 [Termitomyces sp. Mi166|nr:hypothetical protein C0995_015046 [Termitomyces sp. Mi166\
MLVTHLVFCTLSILTLSLRGVTPVTTIETSLNIVNKDIAPDYYPRPAVLANGTFPGPTIFGTKVRAVIRLVLLLLTEQGDRFIINVTNSLTDERILRATSIHWHGLFQNGTNWADGPAMVTQCPIVPNASFVYDFNIHNQAGTFWYHSHYCRVLLFLDGPQIEIYVATQYCDGLRGVIVIYDPEDPYKDEYDVDDASPTPLNASDSLTTLINGYGRTLTSEVTLNTVAPLAVIYVEPGKRYRFRLVSLACDAPFNFTIHGHKMKIIETDGEYSAPLVVDSLWLYAGQRYSVIVHTDRPINNYWIRADPLSATPGFDDGRNSAILRYHGAPEEDPKTNDISTKPLNEDDLNALRSPHPPGKPELGGADIVIPIRPTWNSRVNLFDINGIPYSSPSVPVLLQILNGTYDANRLMPNGSVYKLKSNSSVELQLHGISQEGPHSFWVIKNALSNTFNWINPSRRDVVPTGFDTNLTVIRFITDNAGPWFLHCHIDWHIPL